VLVADVVLVFLPLLFLPRSLRDACGRGHPSRQAGEGEGPIRSRGAPSSSSSSSCSSFSLVIVAVVIIIKRVGMVTVIAGNNPSASGRRSLALLPRETHRAKEKEIAILRPTDRPTPASLLLVEEMAAASLARLRIHANHTEDHLSPVALPPLSRKKKKKKKRRRRRKKGSASLQLLPVGVKTAK